MASNVRFVDGLKVGAYNTGQSSGGGGGSNIDIQNNTNNFLLTATGTNTINGEQNLTFDGSTLTLKGDFVIDDQGAGSDLILIQNPSGQGIQVNNAGTLVLNEFATLPTPVDGGIAYSSSNFYVGLG